jgi:hypothetical protein
MYTLPSLCTHPLTSTFLLAYLLAQGHLPHVQPLRTLAPARRNIWQRFLHRPFSTLCTLTPRPTRHLERHVPPKDGATTGAVTGAAIKLNGARVVIDTGVLVLRSPFTGAAGAAAGAVTITGTATGTATGAATGASTMGAATGVAMGVAAGTAKMGAATGGTKGAAAIGACTGAAAGALVTGALVTGDLVIGDLVTGVLVTGALVTGALVTGDLVGERVGAMLGGGGADNVLL